MTPWGENRSGGTGGSHAGLNGLDLSPVGEARIPKSRGTKRTRRGCPAWGRTDQVEPGVPTLEWILFLDLSPRAKPYCWCHQSLLLVKTIILINNHFKCKMLIKIPN